MPALIAGGSILAPGATTKAILDTLNPTVVKRFIEVVGPYWLDCCKVKPVFTAFYYIFGFFFTSSLIRPAIFKALKGTWYFTVSGLALAWGELLEGWSVINTIYAFAFSLIPGLDFSFLSARREEKPLKMLDP